MFIGHLLVRVERGLGGRHRYNCTVRMVIVTAQGRLPFALWPALWMLLQEAGPWPTGGEMDIMESMAKNHVSSNFDLDPNSTSSAVQFRDSSSRRKPALQCSTGVIVPSMRAKRRTGRGHAQPRIYFFSKR